MRKILLSITAIVAGLVFVTSRVALADNTSLWEPLWDLQVCAIQDDESTETYVNLNSSCTEYFAAYEDTVQGTNDYGYYGLVDKNGGQCVYDPGWQTENTWRLRLETCDHNNKGQAFGREVISGDNLWFEPFSTNSGRSASTNDSGTEVLGIYNDPNGVTWQGPPLNS